mgnify:CR=1 FL=1
MFVYWLAKALMVFIDWDASQAQNPDTLDFQDNWDEDANDKNFVAQLRKELGL